MGKKRLIIACVIGTAIVFGESSRGLASGGLQESVSEDRIVEEIAADALTHRLSIPLREGRLSSGLLLGKLAEKFGFDGQAIQRALDISVNVKGKIGGFILSQVQKITGQVVRFDPSPETLVVSFDRLQLRRQERKLRSGFRSLVEKVFPKAAKAAKLRYGLRVHESDRDPVSPEAARFEGPVVLLVHGLDEPGLIWNTLRPALLEAGYTVVEFEYPNDQGLDDSAELMAVELKKLKSLGVTRLRIVAHSMGGLVSRHVLTDARWYSGRGTENPDYPDVDRLIMVGTPQHGSPLAHLHMVGERLDQVIRILSGNGVLFGGAFDGAGEAKLDLLPKSEFLIRLNRRPHPQSVTMTIIAGRASPVSADRIQKVNEFLKNKTGEKLESPIDTVTTALGKISAGLGDGVVSLASSKLDGVEDYTVVDANHISMVLRILPRSKKTPKAIPIILDRLERGRREQDL